MRTTNLSINMQKNKLTKSLQVPCNPLFIISKSYLPGKRVLPFTLRKHARAGMTVEAAFVLPLFVFFSFAILAPMQWLDTQRKMQTVAEELGEKLSLYAYGGEKTTEMEEDGQWKDLLSDAAAGVWLSEEIKEYNREIWVKKSEVPDDAGNVCLEVLYRERIPFFGKLMGSTILRIAVKRRCWTGLEGKLISGDGADSDMNGNREMVYIGETMTRYHTYRDCQYLANQFQTTTLQNVSERRNEDGKRYRPCETCKPLVYDAEHSNSVQYVVYITSRGRHYHETPNCTTMIAYLRKVPLEEVAYLGECSVCARRHHES